MSKERDVLSDIDSILVEAGEIVTVEEVDEVTTFIRSSPDKEAKLALSQLKDAAEELVVKRVDGRWFPGTEALRKEHESLDERFKINQNAPGVMTGFASFRNRAVSHALSTDSKIIPEAMREDVAGIRQRYTVFQEMYKAAKGPPAL